MTILCASLAEFLWETPGPKDRGEPIYVCGWYAPHETTPNVYGLWIVATCAKSHREIVEWRQVVGTPMSKADKERAECTLTQHLNTCIPQLTDKYGARVALNRRLVEGSMPAGSIVHVIAHEEDAG